MKFKTNEYIQQICKPGQGAACCKYLIGNPNGSMECAKVTSSLKSTIDAKYLRESQVAQGDNCGGVKNLKNAKDPGKTN